MARKLIRKKSAKPYVKESVPEKKGSVPKELIEASMELWKIKEQRKLLEKREDELKSRVGKLLEQNAYKDTKGSYVSKITIDGQDKIVKKEARKSTKLNAEKAEEYFRAHKLWDFVSESKQVINESYVEQAFSQGKVPMKDLEKISDTKVNYAILVKDYDPNEEIEGVI